MVDRRDDIAGAGIRIIASRGVRALTHRAVDVELGMPLGSTSYYARTRRDLIDLIVRRLATRTVGDISGFSLPDTVTTEQMAMMLTALLDAMIQRPDEHAVRFALLLEYRDDARLVAQLTTESPIRVTLLAGSELLLRRLGVADAEDRAPDLVGLLDGLLQQRLVGAAPIDAHSVLLAYLTGLPRR